MATHKPFRELIKPGTNFEFMGRAKLWVSLSAILSIACIAMLFVNHATRGEFMNWSTDFKGGTEIIFGFHEAGTDQPADVDPADLRKALSDAGMNDFEISDFIWEEETSTGIHTATGALLRTPEFGAVDAELQEKVAIDLAKEFAAIEPLKVSWSGDRLFVRSKKPVDWKAMKPFLAKHELDLRDWDPAEAERYQVAEEGTGEYQAQLAVAGIDEQFRQALEDGLGKGVDVRVVNVYGVGAKAGSKLRNDAVVSMFYAMLLIMLYLVVRFDLRFAPGAIVALLHDAIMVIGVFAATWTEFSLVTVAATLTVIGYSVNDTVIIFDRIRENALKMQDKKFSRIMNISINETLSRSLLTSLTVFVTTLMMNIFGTGLVRNFAFAMNIGVVTGTYSSIFIASPVVLWIHNRWYGKGGKERGKVVDEAMESTEGAE
ncbi:MAG TPA: protein translocase subunit SecF [Kofleriaceae bacterium]|nr:protein translocase subunit SecF [Kofleriaceae bacterium]